jgi:hypothetical protein
LVTSGGFTKGARDFAQGKPLTLVDRDEPMRRLHAAGITAC